MKTQNPYFKTLPLLLHIFPHENVLKHKRHNKTQIYLALHLHKILKILYSGGILGQKGAILREGIKEKMLIKSDATFSLRSCIFHFLQMLNNWGITQIVFPPSNKSDSLLSEWEVQNKSPAGETEMCSIVAPKRGRNSLFFSAASRHSTSTDSRPPLSRLVPSHPATEMKGQCFRRKKKNRKNSQHLKFSDHVERNELFFKICKEMCSYLLIF